MALGARGVCRTLRRLAMLRSKTGEEEPAWKRSLRHLMINSDVGGERQRGSVMIAGDTEGLLVLVVILRWDREVSKS